MELEQQRPNKPNFALVVTLSAVVMVAIFLFAIFVLHFDGRRLLPHHTAAHATSALRLDSTTLRT